MAATRERLEAVIRQQLARSVAEAMVPACDCTRSQNRAVETILHEVDEYTTAEVGLLTPAERRHVLLEGTS